MSIELIINLLIIGCVVSFATLIGCILIFSICEGIYNYLYYKYYYNTIHNQSINNNDTALLINTDNI